MLILSSVLTDPICIASVLCAVFFIGLLVLT